MRETDRQPAAGKNPSCRFCGNGRHKAGIIGKEGGYINMVLLLLKKQLKAILEKNGSADFETREILKWAIGEEMTYLSPETDIEEEAAQKAVEAAKRRVKGEPLQYIIGEWDFFGITLKVGEGVLIPRPETEILVEKALEELCGDLHEDPENGSEKNAETGNSPRKDEKCTVIDLCSGSGCIPLAIAKNSDAECCGVEISDEALWYFNENIKLLGMENRVRAVKGDVLSPDKSLLDTLPKKCRIITANPPYLTKEEMSNLQKEVRHEPETALFGGTDGLDYYRSIFGIWKNRLEKNGAFIVEVGDGQDKSVKSLMEKEGFRCRIFEDYNKTGRIVLGRIAG